MKSGEHLKSISVIIARLPIQQKPCSLSIHCRNLPSPQSFSRNEHRQDETPPNSKEIVSHPVEFGLALRQRELRRRACRYVGKPTRETTAARRRQEPARKARTEEINQRTTKGLPQATIRNTRPYSTTMGDAPSRPLPQNTERTAKSVHKAGYRYIFYDANMAS